MGQHYDVYVEMEHVVMGNDALMRCKVPSFVADIVEVVGWVDNAGEAYDAREAQMGRGPVAR